MISIPSKVERLGRPELGRYAFETRMPSKVIDAITNEDDSNIFYRTIPILAKLLEESRDVGDVYLCTLEAAQVSRTPNDGGDFCGYRNIQMMLLSLPAESRERLTIKRNPSIPEIQDMIEKAWDAGINAHGRIQTGGMKDTRKYIGTSEAEAILLHQSIPCTGKVFRGPEAWSQLLDYVEAYFTSSPHSSGDKIKQTELAPIFLQRPLHSITIIGFERTRSGKQRLLAFDPAWKAPKLRSRRPRSSTFCSRWIAYWTLRSYRKNERYLKRFAAFETLVIDRPILAKHAC